MILIGKKCTREQIKCEFSSISKFELASNGKMLLITVEHAMLAEKYTGGGECQLLYFNLLPKWGMQPYALQQQCFCLVVARFSFGNTTKFINEIRLDFLIAMWFADTHICCSRYSAIHHNCSELCYTQLFTMFCLCFFIYLSHHRPSQLLFPWTQNLECSLTFIATDALYFRGFKLTSYLASTSNFKQIFHTHSVHVLLIKRHIHV